MTEVLALIPARGGSKGIPRKNLVVVGGVPLLCHSIRHAQQSRLVTRTVVSTEDPEIAEVARASGAEVPFMRPGCFATDLATDLDVFMHVLSLMAAEGYRPELVVHLRPTSPIRDVQVVDAAIAAMLADPTADSLKSVSPAASSPYKMWALSGDTLQPVLTIEGLPEAHSMPRQILPTTYVGNGVVDILRPRCILEQESMVGQRTLPLVMEEPTFDLDHRHQLPAIERALAGGV